MELDTLKTIWREQQIPATTNTPPGRLQQLLQKKARGPIAHIHRNLRLEGILVLAIYVPIILNYLAAFDGRSSLFATLLSLVLFLYVIYFYLKSRLLRRMQCITCEVRSNLVLQVRMLGKYVSLYLWSGTLLAPILLIVAYVFMGYQSPPLPFRTDHPLRRPGIYSSWIEPVSMVTLIILFTIALYFLNKWYVNKMYGRHIEKIKAMLLEMDEE
jgi:hypothetical protein